MFEYRMTEINNDQELVNEFISGNESAFNRLAKRYQEKIYWHARRMTGNHLDADEIVQQVLLVMYNKLKTFNFDSSLYTWIYKITSTRSLNLIKRNKLRSFISIDNIIENRVTTKEDIILDLETKERLEKVERLLQRISPKQREVFIFRKFDELSYEELLYAASLAFRPEDKLIIYNAAFIHIDRDWRAYNNAAVSAIHVASLGQADCYLYQASLISEDNGSIANNRGILACYKDQFDIAKKHFVMASDLGYDALYNLQVVNNLVNELEVERIADRNKIDQNKGTQKAVVDVIDYGTSSSDD